MIGAVIEYLNPLLIALILLAVFLLGKVVYRLVSHAGLKDIFECRSSEDIARQTRSYLRNFTKAVLYSIITVSALLASLIIGSPHKAPIEFFVLVFSAIISSIEAMDSRRNAKEDKTRLQSLYEQALQEEATLWLSEHPSPRLSTTRDKNVLIASGKNAVYNKTTLQTALLALLMEGHEKSIALDSLIFADGYLSDQERFAEDLVEVAGRYSLRLAIFGVTPAYAPYVHHYLDFALTAQEAVNLLGAQPSKKRQKRQPLSSAK